jgi:hypothetical protein
LAEIPENWRKLAKIGETVGHKWPRIVARWPFCAAVDKICMPVKTMTSPEHFVAIKLVLIKCWIFDSHQFLLLASREETFGVTFWVTFWRHVLASRFASRFDVTV